MGNGGGGNKKGWRDSPSPPLETPPRGELPSTSSSSSSRATKRHRVAGMADRYFPNDLPDFVAEAPDGGRGLLSLPYSSLSERLLRAALRIKDKVRHACASVWVWVWVWVARARAHARKVFG